MPVPICAREGLTGLLLHIQHSPDLSLTQLCQPTSLGHGRSIAPKTSLCKLRVLTGAFPRATYPLLSLVHVKAHASKSKWTS